MSEHTGVSRRVLDWRSGGQLEEIAGTHIFIRRGDGPGPLLLFLHGFPSSSYDWRGLLAALEPHATLMLDFLGFGLSEKPRTARYSLLLAG